MSEKQQGKLHEKLYPFFEQLAGEFEVGSDAGSFQKDLNRILDEVKKRLTSTWWIL